MNNLNNLSSSNTSFEQLAVNSLIKLQRIDPFKTDESDNDFTRQNPVTEPDKIEPSKIDTPDPISPPSPGTEPQKSNYLKTI